MIGADGIDAATFADTSFEDALPLPPWEPDEAAIATAIARHTLRELDALAVRATHLRLVLATAVRDGARVGFRPVGIGV